MFSNNRLIQDDISLKASIFWAENGMHWYNNMDHSMLTVITAVDNIVKGITSRENIWKVNTVWEYNEER